MITNFFSPLSFEIRDPGSGMGKNQDPGSGINIPDLPHWENLKLFKKTPDSCSSDKDIGKKQLLLTWQGL